MGTQRYAYCAEKTLRAVRKTPPGRAVIVGKGVGVTAQVDPARPPQVAVVTADRRRCGEEKAALRPGR